MRPARLTRQIIMLAWPTLCCTIDIETALYTSLCFPVFFFSACGWSPVESHISEGHLTVKGGGGHASHHSRSRYCGAGGIRSNQLISPGYPHSLFGFRKYPRYRQAGSGQAGANINLQQCSWLWSGVGSRSVRLLDGVFCSSLQTTLVKASAAVFVHFSHNLHQNTSIIPPIYQYMESADSRLGSYSYLPRLLYLFFSLSCFCRYRAYWPL